MITMRNSNKRLKNYSNGQTEEENKATQNTINQNDLEISIESPLETRGIPLLIRGNPLSATHSVFQKALSHTVPHTAVCVPHPSSKQVLRSDFFRSRINGLETSGYCKSNCPHMS